MTLSQKLSKAFDILWEQADTVLKQNNPCEHCIIKGKHQCLGKKTSYDPEGCCEGCKFLTNKGCSANMPLSCRVWLCNPAQLKNPIVYKKLQEIKKIALDFQLIGDFFDATHRKEKITHIKYAVKYIICRKAFFGKSYYEDMNNKLDTFIKINS